MLKLLGTLQGTQLKLVEERTKNKMISAFVEGVMVTGSMVMGATIALTALGLTAVMFPPAGVALAAIAGGIANSTSEKTWRKI